MRGRDEGGTRLATGGDASGHIHAFLVDRNRDEPATRRAEYAALQAIAGLFDPNRISGIEKYSSCNIQCLLGAGDNHDLAYVALHPASSTEIGGDRFAKAIRAKRIDMVNSVGMRIAAMASDQACPYLEGKLIEGGLGDAKGSPART